MNHEIMRPIEAKGGGCLCCGGVKTIAPLHTSVIVGFGSSAISKNGEIIHDGEREDKIRRLYAFEYLARKEPDADWRLHLVGPLSERHYQRQGKSHWILYAQGEGFA